MKELEQEIFQKIITVNNFRDNDLLKEMSIKFIDFMLSREKLVQYFRLRLKDSEKSPFAKDLLLEWSELKD